MAMNALKTVSIVAETRDLDAPLMERERARCVGGSCGSSSARGGVSAGGGWVGWSSPMVLEAAARGDELVEAESVVESGVEAGASGAACDDLEDELIDGEEVEPGVEAGASGAACDDLEDELIDGNESIPGDTGEDSEVLTGEESDSELCKAAEATAKGKASGKANGKAKAAETKVAFEEAEESDDDLRRALKRAHKATRAAKNAKLEAVRAHKARFEEATEESAELRLALKKVHKAKRAAEKAKLEAERAHKEAKKVQKKAKALKKSD